MSHSPTPHTVGNDMAGAHKPLAFFGIISKPYLRFLIPAILFVTAAQLATSSTAYILKLLVDGVTMSPTRAEQAAELFQWGFIYIAILFVMYACWRGSGFMGIEWLARAKAYAYQRLYTYITQHSHTYFINRFAGALSNKVSNAADGADRLFEKILWHYYPGLLGLLLAIGLLFTVSALLSLVFFVLVCVLVVLNVFLVLRRRPYVIAYAQASSTLRGVGVDLLTNAANMRQFARHPYEMDRLGWFITDRKKKDRKRDVSGELGLVLNNALILAAVSLMMFVVYRLFASGVSTTGDIVLVITVIFNTSLTLVFIGNMLNGFIQEYGEIEEGLSEIIVPHGLTDARDAKALTITKGEIEFSSVAFRHEQNEVFSSLNVHILPGSRVGLVGPSGAGKSTLASLLLRQHDLQGGDIRIDGQNIAQVAQDSLRESVAFVSQEPMLFHRTIRENIAYGKLDATDEEVQEAARLAQAHDFIAELPDGYDTLVGERGVKLSGGERQRVAIARAILKNAPILVLDEATSSLDSESEIAIQKALHVLMEGKTVIAIAHRLSTLREMDRILVLEKGEVVEDGTHTQLLSTEGRYAELWSHQAGGFIPDPE